MYGGTAYGMGQQIIDDTRDMSDYLRDKEHLWGALLGNLVFHTCYEKLPGPATMLRLFQEIADVTNSRGEYLTWVTPVINAPVIQAYRKPTTKRTKLRYGDDELKINIESWDETTLDSDASRTGAAPNIVHSFDAAHLAMVVDKCNFQVSVIHDSFGSHAGNMGRLFVSAREEFVNFYKTDPLMQILKQLGCEDMMPPRGNLDISKIMESDYAFC